MQKFTRALTREVEVGGERLAVTLSEVGLEIRPVGSRRPPHSLSWAACVCACARHPEEPTEEEVAEALKTLKAGGPRDNKKADPPAASEASEAPQAPQTSAPSKEASGGQALPDLLRQLDEWLARHRKRFYHALLPGASAADLQALEKALGSPIPEELRTWLSWHNGQSADVVGAFEGSWNLMSAEDIAQAKEELDAEAHEGWHKAYIPFLDDDHGDYLCLDPHTAGVPVRECWRGRAEHAAIAPSLTAWVRDFVTALERGTYHEDPERGTFLRR
jgi:cell wall assembly regulator SMI1